VKKSVFDVFSNSRYRRRVTWRPEALLNAATQERVKSITIGCGTKSEPCRQAVDMDHTVSITNNTISDFTSTHRASPPFGRYSLCLPMEGWPGWVNLGGWLNWDEFPHRELNPNMVTHPSTNRARRRITSLIWPTSLPTMPNLHRYSNSSSMKVESATLWSNTSYFNGTL